MKSKIILPYFTEEKYKSKRMKIVHFYSYLEKSDGSHLFLVRLGFKSLEDSSNTYEFITSLFRYSSDFSFVKEIPVAKVFEEISKVFSDLEFSLLELSDDRILISTTLNRAYLIDESGNINEKSYAETLSHQFSTDNTERQNIASNNLFFKAKLVPNTKKYLALVDGTPGYGGDERRKRGDFIVKATELLFGHKPKFKLIASLDKTPSTSTPFDFPNILHNSGASIKKDDIFTKNLCEQVKVIRGESMWHPWVDDVYPLKENLTLIPFFEKALRMGGKGRYYIFLLINDEGKVINWLKEVGRKTHNPYKLEEFNFAINFDDQLIYYKAESTFFIFDFTGNCVNKIEFAGKLKTLTNFRFISLINSKNLLFYNRKNYHFLIVHNFETRKDNDDNFLEAIANFRKKPINATMQ